MFGLIGCSSPEEIKPPEVSEVAETDVIEEEEEETTASALLDVSLSCDATVPTAALFQVPEIPVELIDMPIPKTESCEQLREFMPDTFASRYGYMGNVLDVAAIEAWVASNITEANGWTPDENAPTEGTMVRFHADGSRVFFSLIKEQPIPGIAENLYSISYTYNAVQ